MHAVRSSMPETAGRVAAHRLVGALLVVMLFPVFSLDLHERTPFTPGMSLAPDQWFRLSWLVILGGILVLTAWKLRVWTWHYDWADVLLVSLPVAATLSVLYWLPLDVMAWYRIAGLWLTVFSSVVAVGYARHMNQDGFEALLWAFLGMAVVMLGVLLLTALWQPERVVRIDGPRTRLGGDVYNPIPLSVNLVLAQVSVAMLALRRRLAAWVGLLLFVGFHVGVFFTFSRTGWVLAALADVGVLYLVLKPVARRWLGYAMLGGLLAAGGLLLHPESRGWLTSHLMAGIGAEERLFSLSGRIPLYREGLRGIQAHPWGGVGYGEGVRHYLSGRLWGPLHTHNVFLQLALGMGAVLSLPFFALLLRAVWGGVQVYVDALQTPHLAARTGVALCLLLVFLDMQVNGGLGYGVDHSSIQALLLVRLLGEIKLR
jgi:hypothetical protein